MTTAPAIIPIRPKWTIHGDGKPTPEAVESLARLCLAIARAEIAAEREAAGDGDDTEVTE
jgi:hypothetical protein